MLFILTFIREPTHDLIVYKGGEHQRQVVKGKRDITTGEGGRREVNLGEQGGGSIRALGHSYMFSSKYTKRIRISEDNLVWLQEHKEDKTMAGLLDEIVSEYKKSL